MWTKQDKSVQIRTSKCVFVNPIQSNANFKIINFKNVIVWPKLKKEF